MRFPYMRRETQLYLMLALACYSAVGLGIYGFAYCVAFISEPARFLPVMAGSVAGIGLGLIFGIPFLSEFIDMRRTDKRKERYRTVKTY